VGSYVEGMGIEMICILTYGKDDIVDIPQIEGPLENGMDSVVLIELGGGNVNIIGIPPREFPPGPIEDGIIG
jgi:hypothetical protein